MVLLLLPIASFMAPAAYAEEIIEFDFLITKNDTVSLYNTRVFEGKRDTIPDISDYELTIYDTRGYAVVETAMPVYFVILDPLEEIPETLTTLRVPYQEGYHQLGVYHQGKRIYEENISFLCQADGVCTSPENVISCPADCFSGAKDGLCDRLKDSICDPDCLAGKASDSDCNGNPNRLMDQTLVLGGIIFFVILIVTIGIMLYVKKILQHKHK